MIDLDTYEFDCYLIGGFYDTNGVWKDFSGEKSEVEVTWEFHGDASTFNIQLKDDRIDCESLSEAVEGENFSILPQDWREIRDWVSDLDDQIEDDCRAA
tara:strand:- start:1269 stop:1565 length:297 start_codon:yes stop_codon:yes gene_type:complete